MYFFSCNERGEGTQGKEEVSSRADREMTEDSCVIAYNSLCFKQGELGEHLESQSSVGSTKFKMIVVESGQDL